MRPFGCRKVSTPENISTTTTTHDHLHMNKMAKRKRQEAPSKEVQLAPSAKKPKKRPTRIEPFPFVDNPLGDELKREVDLYEALGSEDEGQRIAAANAVITGLLGNNGEGGVATRTLESHLERRLFRGLASGRQAARIGRGIVLAEVLWQLFGDLNLSETKYNGLTFEKLVGMLEAKTKPDGDLSGQEEKDHWFGLLFGLQSFVEAKVIFRGQEDRWNRVMELLLKLGEKKPWIRENCGWVMVQATQQMTEKSQAEATIKALCDAGFAASPEGLAVWLTARSRFPDMDLPSKPWGSSGSPHDHLKTLAKSLKESVSSSDDGKTQQQMKLNPTWNPKLHFVWDLVLSPFIQDAGSGADGVEAKFSNFWKLVVDESLFAASSSPERKFWGFLAFQKMLQSAADQPKLLKGLFSHNLVRCLITHAAKPDKNLHEAADKSLKVIQETVESYPESAIPILEGLMCNDGAYEFDRITKTKTIDKLLMTVVRHKEKTDDLLYRTLATIRKPIIRQETSGASVKDIEQSRQIFAEYIESMIRQVNPMDQPEGNLIAWVSSALLSFFSLSYQKGYKPLPSDKTREVARSHLLSALAHLASGPGGVEYTYTHIGELPECIEMDATISEARDKALAQIKELRSKAKAGDSKNEKSRLHALGLLYCVATLQLYNGDSEALSLLEELQAICESLEESTGSEQADALIEILLSFAAKPSLALRRVTVIVFSAFSDGVSAEGLQLMTDVLATRENLKGQEELFDQDNVDEGEDDGEDGDDSDANSDELDSDVEMVDLKDVGNNKEPVSDDSEEEESEDDDASDDSDAEDEANPEEADEEALKLDAALAAALGTHRADEDLKAESSDSDADMTDSEMMALDSKLVEIFKQREEKSGSNKKRINKDAKENIVNFKTRVLDLLEIYVRKQAARPQALDLLMPLLKLVRETKSSQLRKKALNIVAGFPGAARKTKNVVGEGEVKGKTVKEQIELLKKVHKEVLQDPSQAFSKAASSASLAVASSVLRVDKKGVAEVKKVYGETQKAWPKEGGGNKARMEFFEQWRNWCQSQGVEAKKNDS